MNDLKKDFKNFENENTENIKNKSGKRLPETFIFLYVLLVAAYFFSYFFRVSSSVVMPVLASEWGMNASLVGFISSLYFYMYAFMQPISGALNDKFGPTYVVSAGIFVTGIGALLFGFAPNPLVLSIGRLLTGLGLAPMLSGVLVYQANRFPKNKYAFFSGITYTVGNFGAVISVAPLAFAISSFGRNMVFVFLAVINVILAVLIFSRRKDDPILSHRKKKVNVDSTPLIKQMGFAIKKIFKTKQLIFMLVLWGISFGSLMSLQGLWAVSWYQTSYGISSNEASSWATLIGIGVMLGNFFGAHIARDSKSRKKVIAIACSVYSISWLVLLLGIYSHVSVIVVGILGCILGLAAGVSYVHLTAGVNDISPAGKNGALFGMMNFFVFVCVIVFQWGTGVILQNFPGMTEGIYTHEGYMVTFTVVTVLALVSLFALLFIRSFSDFKGDE